MNNLRLLTGGLALIVLILASGTGYLIWERVQSEINSPQKATKQEVESIKTNVTTLQESDKLQSTKIAVLEQDMADTRRRLGDAEQRIDSQGKVIEKLKTDKAGKADLDKAQAELDQLKKDQSEQKNRLTTLEGKMETAEKDRADIRKQLAAQGVRIDEQEKKLNELSKKGDAHDKEIAALRAEIEELKKAVGIKPPPPSE